MKEPPMKPIRRILIAVKNPDSRRQPGVDKAIRIAKLLGASVELFHAISSPVFLELEPLTGQSLAQIKRESLALRRARLERLAQQARKLGVRTTSHVAWDFPPHGLGAAAPERAAGAAAQERSSMA
jgi:nucleotide-binding universal stress UspA family protein